MVGIRSGKKLPNRRGIGVRATPGPPPRPRPVASYPTPSRTEGGRAVLAASRLPGYMHSSAPPEPAMRLATRFRTSLLVSLLVVAVACTIRVIQPAPLAGPAGGGGPKPDSAKKDLPWKPFAEVTKDARVQTGLFTAYLKRESAYLALKPEQLDHDYLMVTELSQGIGELGIDGGSDVRSDLIRFHRSGDHVELWVVNPYATATPNTPMARTVAYSFGNSVAQSFPIASVRDTTNEVLVDLAPFFVSDWADLGAFFQFLSQLPPTPMRPRYADDRVGYFVSAMKNFSRDTAETFFVRYVNRWRLEKKDPSAAVSDPVKPITYYLD